MGYFPPRTDDRLGRGTGDFKIPERYSLSAGYESNKADAIAYNVGVDLSQEDLGASDISGSAGITWRPNDRFSSRPAAPVPRS